MSEEKNSPAPAQSPFTPAAESAASPTYRVMLPEFEGPLDLLLHLCQTHEIDILNISIDFIAKKYIEYLELMENMAVEVAADYLVMAAHLAYLKSRELVPSPEPLEASEDGEEPLDPREELIRRLLEYQKYKHAAENLGSRPIEGRNVFVRGAVLESEGEAGLAEHSVWKLIEHWAGTLKKAKPEYTHDVVMDRTSISDRINEIVDMLEAGKGMVRFEELLGQGLNPAELRHKIVVSLLAVLELARLRVVRILQQLDTGTFFLAQVEGAAMDDARHLNVTSAKETEPSQKAAEAEAEAEAQEEAEVVVPATSTAPFEPAADLPSEDSAVSTDDLIADMENLAAELTDPEPEPDTEVPTQESLAETPADEPVFGEDTQIQDPVTDGPREPVELRPQEEVISAPSPASAAVGEEATDGQTQEEQTTPEE